MKKIIIPILIFLVVSLCFLNYECQETVMKINAEFNSDTPKNQNLEKTTKIQETKGKVNLNTYKRKYVNILLTNNFDTNIYQKKIILKGKSLNVYYGKKYSNKTNKRKIEITTESYMFKKNNVLKIYSNNIEWANHNVEHNSPVYSGTFEI